MAYNFQIKGVYSFDVYPSSILGTDFQNVTVVSIMDYETAIGLADIPSIHVNVYPHLPSGLPDDPRETDYIKIKTTSGNYTILGLSWINDSTVTVVESLRATVIIENISSSDVPRLSSALAQNGFNNFVISLNSVPVTPP